MWMSVSEEGWQKATWLGWLSRRGHGKSLPGRVSDRVGHREVLEMELGKGIAAGVVAQAYHPATQGAEAELINLRPTWAT